MAVVAGAVGLLALCGTARAQVGLPSDPLGDPLGGGEQTVTTVVDDVGQTVDTVDQTVGTVEDTVDQTVGTVEDTVDQTVDTVEDTVDQTVGTVEDTVDGVVGDEGPTADVKLPDPGLEADVSGQLPDLVGGLLGDTDPARAGVPAAETVSGADAVPLGSSAVQGAHEASPTGSLAEAIADGGSGSGDRAHNVSVPGSPGSKAARPFVLAARDVRTFGLPLVVALLLGAYLGLERWLGGRDPRAVAITVRDEVRRFE